MDRTQAYNGPGSPRAGAWHATIVNISVEIQWKSMEFNENPMDSMKIQWIQWKLTKLGAYIKYFADLSLYV